LLGSNARDLDFHLYRLPAPSIARRPNEKGSSIFVKPINVSVWNGWEFLKIEHHLVGHWTESYVLLWLPYHH
jgi:hypothetical protein